MKKQPHITEQTRKKLLNGFWKLYKKKDINQITVKDMCDIASYERTTFYRYFTDITDILNQLEDNVINSIKADISIKFKSKKPTTIFLEGFTNFTSIYGEYIVIFSEKGNINFYKKFKELIKTDVYDYLSININNEKKKDFIFEFIFSSLLNSFVYWYRHQKTMSIESFILFANNILSIENSSIFK